MKWVGFVVLGCEFAALAELFFQAAELPLKVGIGVTGCAPRLGFKANCPCSQGRALNANLICSWEMFGLGLKS